MSNNSKIQEWEFTDYINSLIVRDESVDLEFKTASEGFPNSLWETYSAFANTDGGVIVLGVREKKNNLIVEGLTSEQIQQYKKRFWNEVNNPDCISFNLLTDKDIFEGEYEGKKLLLISIPRANRSQRPVYCTRNPFRGHTYKRNNEGDYKCTNEEVKRMIATCFSESSTNNDRLQHLLNMHPSDITKMLRNLCMEGFLISEGKGRGTLYQVNIKRPQNVATSEGNVATSKRAYVYETTKKHLSYNEIADLICNMTKDFLFLDEIASSIGRNVRYLNNRIIPRMIEEQRLERLYPDIPNHPKQKYRAKNNK